eukprot:scaffold422316_cov38-Prasinocladus_malaysianus.AAC.2
MITAEFYASQQLRDFSPPRSMHCMTASLANRAHIDHMISSMAGAQRQIVQGVKSAPKKQCSSKLKCKAARSGHAVDPGIVSSAEPIALHVHSSIICSIVLIS